MTTSAGRWARARRQALEDRGGELGRAEEDGAHGIGRRGRLLGGARRPPAPRASRASPPCAPRARCGRGSARRRGGRSRAGSPAPRSPSASISSGSPLARPAPRTRTARGALDLDVHAGQAQAALFGDLELLALPLEHRVDQRGERVLGVGAVDEHAVQHAELGRGEARRPSASCISSPIRSTSCLQRARRSARPAAPLARSTGSPSLRTWRSAASRRAASRDRARRPPARPPRARPRRRPEAGTERRPTLRCPRGARPRCPRGVEPGSPFTFSGRETGSASTSSDRVTCLSFSACGASCSLIGLSLGRKAPHGAPGPLRGGRLPSQGCLNAFSVAAL